MEKTRITLPDGRYLIYYRFDDEEPGFESSSLRGQSGSDSLEDSKAQRDLEADE